DSNEQSQMDIAPFRNIINEMYAKDTSRKIKSALRTRKKSGKYISSGAPFGYQKDPADHNHLVIDPNTAPVVEYIYSMAEEGLGLHRIAKRLHDEKVLKPCYYKKEMFGRFIDDEKMYDWDSAYISQVLHSPVYAGHIIYEAKPTVSMKSKKRRYIPFEERAIVPNTHEAIIPQDRWENVQRILYSRSGCFMCDKTDYDNIFKGIVRCADCGRTMLVKVEHRRKRNSVLDQTFYCCSTYRKYGAKACDSHNLEARVLHEAVFADIQAHAKAAVSNREALCCSTYRKYGAKACDSHNLEARVLHEAVFADIQAHAKAAVSNREALVKKIANQMHLRVSSDRAQHKRDLKQCKARIAEIEDLYAKLYEDVSKGLLPEKRFQMLADRYDKEQAELTEKIEQYEREGRAEHDQLDKIQDFIDEVSKYAGITELNYKILHQLIDKILVSKAEKVDGEYVQKIQIFYRFIGPLDAIE
ncbi:recombinase zinc beta ribbon domain-containing protein, partial [Faecalibacterium prausnitzii]